jgi:hypothetical protein
MELCYSYIKFFLSPTYFPVKPLTQVRCYFLRHLTWMLLQLPLWISAWAAVRVRDDMLSFGTTIYSRMMSSSRYTNYLLYSNTLPFILALSKDYRNKSKEIRLLYLYSPDAVALGFILKVRKQGIGVCWKMAPLILWLPCVLSTFCAAFLMVDLGIVNSHPRRGKGRPGSPSPFRVRFSPDLCLYLSTQCDMCSGPKLN